MLKLFSVHSLPFIRSDEVCVVQKIANCKVGGKSHNKKKQQQQWNSIHIVRLPIGKTNITDNKWMLSIYRAHLCRLYSLAPWLSTNGIFTHSCFDNVSNFSLFLNHSRNVSVSVARKSLQAIRSASNTMHVIEPKGLNKRKDRIKIESNNLQKSNFNVKSLLNAKHTNT